MLPIPVQYIEPVFRPPSEARSFILQVTNGCSWNKCTFCEMYTQPQKAFRARKDEEIFADIRRTAAIYPGLTRVFLADGDAMVLPVRRLRGILQMLNDAFPALERVSAYCLPRNLRRKSVEDLRALRELKLDIMYVGVESGCDTVLEKVQKGETAQSHLEALIKIRDAGLRSSVMVLNGLGGTRYWEAHADDTAALMNKAQPDFLSTLVVSFPLGQARLKSHFPEFELPDQQGLFRELHRFISGLELKQTVFRSDHASNYLPLKGTLNRDKRAILDVLEIAMTQPGKLRLRQEWERGL